MSGMIGRVYVVTAMLCAALATAGQAAQPVADKATITVYIDARKASGHPWHGPGDLIISAPLKHVPTPITKLPEAPGAVLCVVRMDENIVCPGVRTDATADHGGGAQEAVTDAELPAAVEQFYKLLQVHDTRGAPTRAYRDASARLFGRTIAPSGRGEATPRTSVAVAAPGGASGAGRIGSGLFRRPGSGDRHRRHPRAR